MSVPKDGQPHQSNVHAKCADSVNRDDSDSSTLETDLGQFSFKPVRGRSRTHKRQDESLLEFQEYLRQIKKKKFEKGSRPQHRAINVDERANTDWKYLAPSDQTQSRLPQQLHTASKQDENSKQKSRRMKRKANHDDCDFHDESSSDVRSSGGLNTGFCPLNSLLAKTNNFDQVDFTDLVNSENDHHSIIAQVLDELQLTLSAQQEYELLPTLQSTVDHKELAQIDHQLTAEASLEFTEKLLRCVDHPKICH
jgi:hypothetical protein